MKILINIKAQSEMPYVTNDFYTYDKDGNLVFDIVNANNDLFTKMVLVHAIVEEAITEYKGVTAEQITKWDLDHDDAEEPGELPDAPYRDAHMTAKAIEMLICAQLGIDWNAYQGGL